MKTNTLHIPNIITTPTSGSKKMSHLRYIEMAPSIALCDVYLTKIRSPKVTSQGKHRNGEFAFFTNLNENVTFLVGFVQKFSSKHYTLPTIVKYALHKDAQEPSTPGKVPWALFINNCPYEREKKSEKI